MRARAEGAGSKPSLNWTVMHSPVRRSECRWIASRVGGAALAAVLRED